MPPQVLVNATARPRTAELFTSVVKLRFNICTLIRISWTSLNDLSPYKNTSQVGTSNETHAIGAWPRSALTAELQSSHLHQRWSASRSAVLRCACCTIRAAIPNKSSRVGLVRIADVGAMRSEWRLWAQYDRCYKSIARLLFYKLNVRRLDS